MTEEKIWLSLLNLMEKINRAVKEPGWIPSDKEAVYALKDAFLEKLLKEHPESVTVTLYYCPYLCYSVRTKDAAGELMRRDGRKYPFEYYLRQVKPCSEDRNDPSRATIEVCAECGEQSFSFHMPVSQLPAEYSIEEIPEKEWIPAPEFHHQQLCEAQNQYHELIKNIAEMQAADAV